MKVNIQVNHDGTTCDVTVPGEFTIRYTSESIVKAIEFCEENEWDFSITYAEFKGLRHDSQLLHRSKNQ